MDNLVFLEAPIPFGGKFYNESFHTEHWQSKWKMIHLSNDGSHLETLVPLVFSRDDILPPHNSSLNPHPPTVDIFALSRAWQVGNQMLDFLYPSYVIHMNKVSNTKREWRLHVDKKTIIKPSFGKQQLFISIVALPSQIDNAFMVSFWSYLIRIHRTKTTTQSRIYRKLREGISFLEI